MGELIVILAIVVLLFGAKRLPELASGMGKAIKNFRRGVEGDDELDVTPPEKQVGEASGAGTSGEGAADTETGDRGESPG
jgi:sec-independent protein translocase protein TatA